MLPSRDTETEPVEMNREMESCVIYWGTDPRNGLGPLPLSLPNLQAWGFFIYLPNCLKSTFHYRQPETMFFSSMNESMLVQPIYVS